MILIEVIFSLILFSIISIVSSNLLLNVYKKDKQTYIKTNENMILETTRLFLITNNNFNILKYNGENHTLKYDNNLLLDGVSSYSVKLINGLSSINICINHNNICQIWNIKYAQ